ncbi:MAG: hypothetical protein QOD98_765 [Nocardioidaceae bacterium]|jgi:uncharacterized protein YlxW (UPF0749 family)|nr:hypothetical protein [Nocardioidaceae bacterium]
MTNATTTRDPAPLPDRVTMPLLALVTSEAVDEDYVHAARRRAAGGTPQPAPHRTSLRWAAVATVLFGLLIALAAVQTARNAPVQEASRDALVNRIGERQQEVASLRDRLSSLRRQNDSLQSTSSRVQGQLAEATVQLRSLQLSTGYVAVHGPGLRITVSDNPDGSADGRVRATDLRLLVNGLWRAGAEAIAINGHRLTTISAIVNANISVQVNRSPLTPPYVVSAIGDRSIAGRLQATTSDVEFRSLADQFGFTVRQNESELVLPAAPDAQLRLRYAGQGSGGPDNQEDVP